MALFDTIHLIFWRCLFRFFSLIRADFDEGVKNYIYRRLLVAHIKADLFYIPSIPTHKYHVNHNDAVSQGTTNLPYNSQNIDILTFSWYIPYTKSLHKKE